MQIPTFEMLCLLPNAETFAAGRSRKTPRGRWKLTRFVLSLEQVSELAKSQDTVVMVMRKGFGYAAKFGHTYLKLDRKRVYSAGYKI